MVSNIIRTTACFGLFASCAVGPLGRCHADDTNPNIVFILADDLGYGDVGCFGQNTIQTPRLDRLAEGGRRYTQFYAGSTVCAPSRCVLMTGLHTGHCLIRGNAKDNLRPEDVTMAEVLHKAGYTTGLMGKWGLGHEGSTGVPTRQGFDQFFGYLDQHHAHNYYPAFLMRNEDRVPLRNVVPGDGDFGGGVATQKEEYSHDLIMEEALKFVDQNKQKPFFLYLALTTPHANNEAGKQGMEVPDYGPYANKDWPEPQKGHAAMVTRMDGDIGRLLDRLQTHGLTEKTFVFFSSDNGPHAEGGNDPTFFNSSGALKGIKRSLTEGGIRVPTIASWPGKIPAGTSSDFVGAFWDLMPTFADVAGATDFLPETRDGISFAADLMGKTESQKQHDYLYWAFYERGGAQALRMGDWKLVHQPLDSKARLYNLADDLGEENDIADAHPEVVAKAKERMKQAYIPSPRWVLQSGKQGRQKKTP